MTRRVIIVRSRYGKLENTETTIPNSCATERGWKGIAEEVIKRVSFPDNAIGFVVFNHGQGDSRYFEIEKVTKPVWKLKQQEE